MNKGIILLMMIPWLITYGDGLTLDQARKVAIAIVEPENISPKNFPGLPTSFYGYVSVGEVNESRSYWVTMQKAPWVLEDNADWPGAHRIDIRARSWQELLLTQVIPEIAHNGFKGLFLDTIDVPLYLEDSTPKAFRGSRSTLVKLIHTIKKKFPQLGILPNNGLPVLMEIGDVIDGVVVEDLYTRYNFTKKTYDITPTEVSLDKETLLDAFVAQFHKPVFVVLYGDPNSKLVKTAITRCQTKGYQWYVADVSLNTAGTVAK